jgi:hypothetical protein
MKKVISVLEYFSTNEYNESITLKEQNISITGPRKICILSAIRRVTQGNFSQMMEQNRNIHKALEFNLKSSRSIRIQKKNEKDLTCRERILSQKEREIKVASERTKKMQQF